MAQPNYGQPQPQQPPHAPGNQYNQYANPSYPGQYSQQQQPQSAYAYAQPQPAYVYAQPVPPPYAYGQQVPPPQYAAQPQVVVVDSVGKQQQYSPQAATVSSAAPVVQSTYTEQMQKLVRQGFIRKVYSVLGVQLAVTFGIVALFTFSTTVKNAVQSQPGILWAAILASFVFLIVLACCPGVARSYPGNYICLAGFTLCEGYLVGAIASFYNTDAVLLAAGGTVILAGALTIYAWQTKIDFTAMGGVLIVVLLCFILFGIVVAIDRSRILRTLYAAIGLLVFGLFLIIDTQMVLGGDRMLTYGPDDYVFAALNIYVDIIQMFLFLLRIFGDRN